MPWTQTTNQPMIRETNVQSQVMPYQRHKKKIVDASLLNTQHYKVRIKGKWGNQGERNSNIPNTLV